jgi:hypothetical protein
MTKLSLAGKKLIPARESLDSDILAGDGKMANLFLQCTHQNKCFLPSLLLIIYCLIGDLATILFANV